MEQEFAVGDLVLAMGDPAEVLRTNKGPFGYTSVRIRYLDRPPLPEIREDEFPARYVTLLVPASNLRESMLTQVENMPAAVRDTVRERVSKASPEQLMDEARAALVEMHKSGLLRSANTRNGKKR
jgi:hypothetical protein